MGKKRKKQIPDPPPEWKEQHERTQALLAERIAYHRARIAEQERAEHEREAS